LAVFNYCPAGIENDNDGIKLAIKILLEPAGFI
jgi:hypothetical protein